MTTAQRKHVLGLLERLEHVDRMLVTNARCLGEGVDIRALDSIVFADPRRSRIEVVQAVGRAIRWSKDKVSTIVLPVVLSSADDPDDVLRSSEFDSVWQVLSALRSHDERLGEEIDALAFRRARSGDIGGLPARIVLDLPGERVALRAFERAFVSKTIDLTANSGLAAARAYSEEFGSIALVKFLEVYRGFRLGGWINARKQDRRLGRLPAGEVAALEALGIVWDRREMQWQERLALCRAYSEEFGSIASVNISRIYREVPVGTWLHTQRQAQRRGELSPGKVAALDSLGMVWDPLEKQWHEGVEVARAFADKVGPIARVDLNTVYEGFPLGRWLSSRRSDRRTLAPDKIQALDVLGMEWDLLGRKWQEGLAVARAYADEFGSIRRVKPKGVYQEFPLGSWLNTRRYERRRGTLALEKIEALDKLGIVWEQKDLRWQEALSVCRSYAAEFGSIASVRSEVVYGGFPLGVWLNHRRQFRRSGQLSSARIADLDELGMVWDPLPAQWDEALAACRAYGDEFGSIAHVKSGDVYQGLPIGTWLAHRRQFRKKGKLSADRVAVLDELGMIWDTAAAYWAEGLSACRAYAVEHGSVALIKSSESYEGFPLGAWLNSRRQDQRKGKLTLEKVEALDQYGMRWVAPVKALRGEDEVSS